MKIPNNLPQFEDSKTLIMVTGSKAEAHFYLAYNGEVEKLDSFKMEDRTYSDKEGFMQKGMFGRTMGSGFVLEAKKKKIQDDFIKNLRKHLEKIKDRNEIGSLYLFSPSHIKNRIKDAIPHPMDKKIKMVAQGNYQNEHPMKLIEKIKDIDRKENKGLKFVKESAYKILNKVKK